MINPIKAPLTGLALALVISLSACQKQEAEDTAASKLESATEHAKEAAKHAKASAADAAASAKQAASETADKVLETGTALSEKVIEQPQMMPDSGKTPNDESSAKD
jgi:glycerol dehydrogenase-like iron-containing ADH family enzyme